MTIHNGSSSEDETRIMRKFFLLLQDCTTFMHLSVTYSYFRLHQILPGEKYHDGNCTFINNRSILIPFQRELCIPEAIPLLFCGYLGDSKNLLTLATKDQVASKSSGHYRFAFVLASVFVWCYGAYKSYTFIRASAQENCSHYFFILR